MHSDWTHKLLAAALAVIAFAAVVHVSAEIDPCLLDGTPHTSRHATHACAACCSGWMAGASAPTLAPNITTVLCEVPKSTVVLATDHTRSPQPRGPPLLFNA